MEPKFALYLIYTALAVSLDLGIGWVIVPWLIYDGSPRLMQYIFKALGLASLQEFDPNYDPNAETAEWLNTSMKFFWNDALRKLIKDASRRMMSSIWGLKVNAFEIYSMEPPLSLRTIKSQATRNSLSIDFGLMIDLSANIQLSWLVSWIRFGLNNFKMQGLLRVQFEQLLHNDPRLFRSLKVSFLHPPTFDYTFNGLAAILNFMRPIVGFIINKLLVFPKAISLENSMFKNVKEALANQWNTSTVVGILSVTVTPTQPGEDEKLCGCFGLFSPLAILELGNHRAKAKIDSSLKLSKKFPILSTTKEFVLRSSKASLTRHCTIENQVDKALALPLTKLQCFNGCVNMHGKKLHIQTSISSLTPKSLPILSILIIESSSEPKSIEPLVTLQMSGQADYQHTSAGLKSQKWQFHQEFAFIVDYRKTDRLTLGLADYHDCKSIIRKDMAPKLEFMMSKDFAEDDIICASSQIKKLAKYHLRISDLKVNEDQIHEIDLQNEPRASGRFHLVFVSNLRLIEEE